MSDPLSPQLPGFAVAAPTVIAEQAWLDGGFKRDVRLKPGADGCWLAVMPDAEGPLAGGHRVSGWLLPGLSNLHSHAFQRAMAGRTERQSHARDSFWTWRETMYRVSASFGPDTLRDVAAWLYAEMLEAGYTSVCEFHYLHHDRDGQPYADPTEMSLALVEAARDSGIALTLLPVLYQRGGFDGRELDVRQRRFGHDIDGFLALLPVHIHIAEQLGEVQDSLAVTGARPVQWLLDRMPVDRHWTLVHATHMDASEIAGVASAGATVALCPTTEANLGDGLFSMREFAEVGGQWGIGSDSHVSVSPVEELRWLEYGQRLMYRRRNLSATAAHPSVGESLIDAVLDSASAPCSSLRGRFAPGHRADFIVLDPQTPALLGHTGDSVLDAWLFSGNRPAVREVWVGGQRVVADGRHRERDRLFARYRAALTRLFRAP
jgi:formimidoylglutamate deiminase